MIESLHSPHIAAVKALLGSRSKKERKESGLFLAEGMQFLREAAHAGAKPRIETLYLTTSARRKIEAEGISIDHIRTLDVSDDVMAAMGETVTPQGVIGLCELPQLSLGQLVFNPTSKYIYLNEIQDPGNAGTILRSADAMGFSGVITSPNSVDLFSPKVVRASAGSLWHLPVVERVQFEDLLRLWPNNSIFALEADTQTSLLEVKAQGPSLWIFGNEARGLSDWAGHSRVREISIPMAGNAESLNLAAAASIVMFHVSTAKESEEIAD
ncbi:MAG: RNA methyltransferase [Candidatus Nanopelagicaceae bacterium]|nr:RNA methyltransferase [Candidatus Nanopelagicaceae bacterium]